MKSAAERCKLYRERHPGITKVHLKKYRTAHPLRYKKSKQESARRAAHRIEPAWVLEKLKEQHGRCAICQTPITLSACVDHDHATGKLRGMLCNKCNLGLGLFKDSIMSLESAVSYLSRFL